MWEISQETTVSAVHQLRVRPSSSARDERVHGHKWRIKAVVQARELDANGWVLDFNELSAALRTLVAPYEGVFLNEIAPFDDINPTRENIARVVADKLAATIDDGRVRVARVEIWENETRCATYFRG